MWVHFETLPQCALKDWDILAVNLGRRIIQILFTDAENSICNWKLTGCSCSQSLQDTKTSSLRPLFVSPTETWRIFETIERSNCWSCDENCSHCVMWYAALMLASNDSYWSLHICLDGAVTEFRFGLGSVSALTSEYSLIAVVAIFRCFAWPHTHSCMMSKVVPY
jgi:hypothetical protein